MLILFPVLTFLILFLILLGVHDDRREASINARAVFLEATAFVGGLLLLISEGLSLFGLLTRIFAVVGNLSGRNGCIRIVVMSSPVPC